MVRPVKMRSESEVSLHLYLLFHKCKCYVKVASSNTAMGTTDARDPF